MKARLLILSFLLSSFSLAFMPLQQDEIPPIPVIRLDGAAAGQATEDISSFCWPIDVGNNGCDFRLQEMPQNPLDIPQGQALTVIIDNSALQPTSLQATITNDLGVQGYNLSPATQAILEADLIVGTNLVEVIAEYTDLLGVDAYVSYQFQVNAFSTIAEPTAESVVGGVPTPESGQGGAEAAPLGEETPEATEEAVEVAEMTEEPTDEATEEVTEEATEEPTDEATEEVTEEATEEPADEATEEVTEEATEEPTDEATEEVTEEATEEPTDEATEEVTEEATEEVTEEATEEPTDEATEEVTEEATEEPTDEATENDGPSPTATTVALQPQGDAAVADEASPESQQPTATTVPLQSDQPSEVAQAETPEEQEPASPTPTLTLAPTLTPLPPTAPAIQQPDAPPNVQMVFAGRTYQPAGVNFCQSTDEGQRICVDNPIPSDGQSALLLQDFAAQIQLMESPRPGDIGFAFLDVNTLQTIQQESRAGDRLILFDIDIASGVYFLRVDVSWEDTTASYFFRVRVQ